MKEILIVPCHGEVKVSPDTNTITVAFQDIERNKKLKGYTLIGDNWRMVCEDDPNHDDDRWIWSTCIEGRIDTEFVSEEKVDVLCYFLRNSKVEYLVLMTDGSGRYRFLRYSDAKVYYNFYKPTIVFSGDAPYPVTYLDSEVEVVGEAVDLADKCIKYGLEQTQGWEHE